MIDKDIILTRHRETPGIHNESLPLSVFVTSFLFFDGTKTPVAKTVAEVEAMFSFAPINSPAFTGTPTSQTPIGIDVSEKIATTRFVSLAIAPKAPLASPALTGTPTVPTASTGTNTTQAASTAYVMDALAKSVAGLDIKASVRVMAAAGASMSTAYQNGSVVDGVTVVTGDRIGIPLQTPGSNNGIYIVNASGAPTRADDFDSWTEIPGAMFSAEEGTLNHDKIFICTNNAGGTLGTTAITFVDPFQLPGALTSLVSLVSSGNGIIQWNGSAFSYIAFQGVGNYDYAFVNVNTGDDSIAQSGDLSLPWASVQAAYNAGFFKFYIQSEGSSGDLTLSSDNAIYLDGVVGSSIGTLNLNTHSILVRGSGHEKTTIQTVTGNAGEVLTARDLEIVTIDGKGSDGSSGDGGNANGAMATVFTNILITGNVDVRGGTGGFNASGTGGNGGGGGGMQWANVIMGKDGNPAGSITCIPGAGGTGSDGDGTSGSSGTQAGYFNRISTPDDITGYGMVATVRSGVFMAP